MSPRPDAAGAATGGAATPAWRPIALIGPAFVGKTTLVNYLSDDAGFHRVPTLTTRAPRPGEAAHSARQFVSLADLTRRCVGPDWVVTAATPTVWYAIEVGQVRAKAQSGPVIFESSLEGVPRYRAALADLAVVYLRPSDPDQLDAALLQTLERPEAERHARVVANAEWATAVPLADLCLTVSRLSGAALAEFHRSAAAKLRALAQRSVVPGA